MSRQSKFASWQQLKAAAKFKPLEQIKVEPLEKPKVEPTLGELLIPAQDLGDLLVAPEANEDLPIVEVQKPIKKITKKTTEE